MTMPLNERLDESLSHHSEVRSIIDPVYNIEPQHVHDVLRICSGDPLLQDILKEIKGDPFSVFALALNRIKGANKAPRSGSILVGG